ncbi:hypothetical protein TNCV_4406071 [Trichonephila clavipes]|nr:hypothetical protein TNCV_4406071 [Trichonephila clavipes]
MFKVIESPAKSEIRSVMRYLSTSAAGIHRQIIEVYGTEAMGDRKFENESGSLKTGEQMSMTKKAQAGPL